MLVSSFLHKLCIIKANNIAELQLFFYNICFSELNNIVQITAGNETGITHKCIAIIKHDHQTTDIQKVLW